jgi:hypothetical protein
LCQEKSGNPGSRASLFEKGEGKKEKEKRNKSTNLLPPMASISSMKMMHGWGRFDESV